MAKMEFWGPFIGHHIAWAAQRTFNGHRVCLAYQKWLPISVDWVNVDQLTFDPKKKAKVFAQYQGPSQQKFFQANCSSPALLGRSSLDL